MTGSGIAPIWRKIGEAASARRRGPAMNNSDTARLTASTLSPTPEPRAASDRISLRGLGVCAVGMRGLLAFWVVPLRWLGAPPLCPPLLVFGIWPALVVATAFIGAYPRRVAAEARRLRGAVAATQLALAREPRVSAV